MVFVYRKINECEMIGTAIITGKRMKNIGGKVYIAPCFYFSKESVSSFFGGFEQNFVERFDCFVGK